MFPIRELQTKKRISKTVTIKDKQGQLRTVTLVVEGPVSVIGCTTREKVYEDNANRSILIYIDGSKEQDARIMTYQKQLRAGQVDDAKEKATVQKLPELQQHLTDNDLKEAWMRGCDGLTELQRYTYLTVLMKLSGDERLPAVVEDLKSFSKGKPFAHSAQVHLQELGIQTD